LGLAITLRVKFYANFSAKFSFVNFVRSFKTDSLMLGTRLAGLSCSSELIFSFQRNVVCIQVFTNEARNLSVISQTSVLSGTAETPRALNDKCL
jgi:hypothetical protein